MSFGAKGRRREGGGASGGKDGYFPTPGNTLHPYTISSDRKIAVKLPQKVIFYSFQ